MVKKTFASINRSLQRKIIAYILAPFLIIFFVLISLVSAAFYYRNIDLLEKELMTSIEIMGDRVNRELNQLTRIATLTSRLIGNGTGFTDENIREIAVNTVSSHPLIFGSAIAFEPYVFSADKRLYSPYAYRTEKGPALIDIGEVNGDSGYDYTSGEWEWWSTPRQQARAGWSAPYVDEGAGNIVMSTYSVPFYRDGRFAGISTVDVALENLFSLIGDIEAADDQMAAGPNIVDEMLRIVGEGRNIFVTRQGQFIHHPNPDYILAKSLMDLSDRYNADGLEQLAGLLQEGKSGMFRLPGLTPDSTTWVFHVPIPSTGWFYLYLLPEATALQHIGMYWVRFIALIILLNVLMMVILWYLSGKITRPITQLHDAAEQVSTGNFNVEVNYRGQDEIGRLTEVFNNMTRVLDSREDDLEREVNARTRQLQSSQEEISRQKEMLEQRVHELADARKATLNMMQDAEDARENLANQLALQQALIDTIPNPVFYKGADSRFMGFNKAYEKTFGVNASDLIGLRVLDLEYLPEQDRKLYQQEDEETIRNQTTTKREMRMPFADGKVHDTLYWVSGFRKSDGTPGGLVGTFIDISEQKEITKQVELARADLADQLALQQALMDTIPNPVFYKDADTRFLGVNKAYEEAFNIKAKDQIGLRTLDLEYIPEEERRKFQTVCEDAIRNQATVRWETRIPLADGRLHDALFGLSAFSRKDGSPGGLVGAFVDITEQKEIAKQLETAKNAAEAASRAKANFLASMSHEIRTPMNGIIGMVDLLRQEELDQDQKLMLQTISDSGQALLTIINDILDFSKIEAGKLDLEYIPISILDVVEGCADTLRTSALQKKVTLRSYVDPALPAFVIGDPVRIRQILINLAGNAIKFSEQGEVFIRADRLDETTGDEIQVRFSVMDNGIGISEEVQKNLFREFSQADASTTRKYGGTGLGLSICRRLTHMMKGKIGVESEAGKGSVFHVVLPFRISDKSIDSDSPNNLGGLSVLLISSSENEIFICKQYLEYWHTEVTVLGSLEEFRQRYPVTGPSPGVVVLGLSLDRAEKFRLRDEFAGQAATSGTRFIILVRGRRTRARMERADIIVIDANPLKRAVFLSAVAIAAGRISPEITYSDEVENIRGGKALPAEEALARGELILVAEDNPTNRDVIGRQLNLLGYTCEMRENGKLALQAWQEKNYALLLTDCHMPEMDGFELAAAIRQRENGGPVRKPVIAITANVLQGEAERCLAAGMDDYIAKPIDMKILRDKLRQWIPHANSAQAPLAATTAAPPSSNRVIDESVLKGMFGDDTGTFREILLEFIAPTRGIITEIRNGWKERSAGAVRQASHKLKSAARSIGAHELADLCAAIETAGKNNDWPTIDTYLPAIDELMDAVEKYIRAL